MRFSTMVHSMADAQARARILEEQGYDAVFTNESAHDPFMSGALIAAQTNRVQIMTYIAVAFARTPMVVAHVAHDLNAFSRGRFTLGLGPQVKAHITRRFSMPWSHPARRMKEFIQAMHAIWDCWYDAKPLKFEGEFYTHTLTSPMFIPKDVSFGRPKVMLAAVGPQMTRVAAEVADGLLFHSFMTERYVREVIVPSVEQVLEEHNRPRHTFRLVGMPFIVVGDNDEALQRDIAAVRRQIAFYSSTPAYRGVLDLHGWGDLHPEMLRLSKLGRWDDMGALVTEEMLHTFAVVGNASQVAREIKKRFDGVFDLLSGYSAGAPSLPLEVIEAMRASR